MWIVEKFFKFEKNEAEFEDEVSFDTERKNCSQILRKHG
jgi:hypothetical protein